MMGKNRIIFLAILVGAVTSCGWKDPDAETLREAEMVMTESPDSALAILHGINESDIKDAIRHKYVVLKAQAECKLNINSGEDKSALREASEYFKKKNELHYLTLAEYYLGVRYEDDYAESMAHFLNAEEAAKKANDDFYLGLAYREMGAIYGACNSFEQELIYMRQALEYLKKANIKDYADYALETLGDALVNNEKYKEAEEVGREIVAIAGERGDSILWGRGLSILGFAYSGLHEYENAVECFESQLKVSPSEFNFGDCRLLGLAYYHLGDKEKTEECFKILSQASDSLHFVPYILEASKGNYQGAIELLKKENQAVNRMAFKSMRQVVTSSIINRREQERALAEMEAGMERRIRIWISVASVLAAGLGVGWLVYYRKRRRRREWELAEYARTLIADVADGEERYRKLRATASRVLRRGMENIDELSSLLYEYGRNPRLNRRLAEMGRKQVEALRQDEKQITELQEAVDALTGGLMRDLDRDFPNLKDPERRLVLYSIAGLSVLAICTLLEISPSQLYSRKSRIRAKIAESDVKRRNEYLEALR